MDTKRSDSPTFPNAAIDATSVTTSIDNSLDSSSANLQDTTILLYQVINKKRAIARIREAKEKSFQSIFCLVYLVFFILYLFFAVYTYKIYANYEAENPIRKLFSSTDRGATVTTISNVPIEEITTQAQILPWIQNLYTFLYSNMNSSTVTTYNMFLPPLILEEGRANFTECKSFKAISDDTQYCVPGPMPIPASIYVTDLNATLQFTKADVTNLIDPDNEHDNRFKKVRGADIETISKSGQLTFIGASLTRHGNFIFDAPSEEDVASMVEEAFTTLNDIQFATSPETRWVSFRGVMLNYMLKTISVFGGNFEIQPSGDVETTLFLSSAEIETKKDQRTRIFLYVAYGVALLTLAILEVCLVMRYVRKNKKIRPYLFSGKAIDFLSYISLAFLLGLVVIRVIITENAIRGGGLWRTLISSYINRSGDTKDSGASLNPLLFSPLVYGLTYSQYGDLGQQIYSTNVNIILVTAFNTVNGVNILFLLYRLFYSLPPRSKLSLLPKTLAKALSDLIHYGIILLIIALAYACFGVLLFGASLSDFKDISASFNTCLLMLLGSFDYSSMKNAWTGVPILVPIFFWSYMILTYMVLINLIIAIILEAYEKVVEEEPKGSNPIWIDAYQALRSRIKWLVHIITMMRRRRRKTGNSVVSLPLMPEVHDYISLSRLLRALEKTNTNENEITLHRLQRLYGAKFSKHAASFIIKLVDNSSDGNDSDADEKSKRVKGKKKTSKKEGKEEEKDSNNNNNNNNEDRELGISAASSAIGEVTTTTTTSDSKK